MKKTIALILSLTMIISLFAGLGTITASAAVSVASPSQIKCVNTVHGNDAHKCYGSLICELCTWNSSKNILTVTAGDRTEGLVVGNNRAISAYLTLLYADDGSPYRNNANQRMTFIVRYKVKSIGNDTEKPENNYAQLGIGYGLSTSYTWERTNIVGVGEEHYEASDREYSLVVTIPKLASRYPMRLLVAGKNCSIEISYLGVIWHSATRDNAVTVKLDDYSETAFVYAEGSELKTNIDAYGKNVGDVKYYDANGNEVTTVSGDMTLYAKAKEHFGNRQILDSGKGVRWYSDIPTTLSDMEGSGTAADPYIITNDAELRCAVREGGSKHFKLANDIVINDSSDPEWYNGYDLKNWIKGVKEDGSTSAAYQSYEMSANSANLYKGTFDGNGHTISGLYIDYIASGKSDRGESAFALFPTSNGATIKNLKLKDVYIKSNTTDIENSHAYGALVGQVFYGGVTVENVAVENVKFELNRTTSLSSELADALKLTIGGVVSNGAGNVTMTDVTVKNVSATVDGSYATFMQPRWSGSIIPFVSSGYKHTLTNVISYGDMDPFSVKNAKISLNGSTSANFVLRTGSTATNVITVGGDVVAALDGKITKFDDNAAFLANLDTFYNNIGDSTNWIEKKDGKLPELNSFVKQIKVDFENNSYAVGGLNARDTAWAVVADGENTVLKRIKADDSAVGWGFMIGDYGDWHNTADKTPLEAGKVYELTFKVKSNDSDILDYAVYSGYSYNQSDFRRDKQEVFNVYTGNKETRFPSVGNRVTVTNDWKEVTTYFTAEEYVYEGNAYTRPHFYIIDASWDKELYFDDFEITPCDNSVSFKLYENKFAKPFVAENGATITMPTAPERANYIFDGWYADACFTNEFDVATVDGNITAYAKWSNAITDLELDTLAVGINDLGIKVTNANSYPVKFNLETDGEVTVSIFTASSDDANVSKSVIWTRNFESSGNIGTLIDPATIKVNGVVGNELYISIEAADGVNASIENIVIGKAPINRNIKFDVNSDNLFDIRDLVALKNMAVDTNAINWLGDIDEDGYIASASDHIYIQKGLLDVPDIETTKGDRTLVWSDEFDLGKMNGNNFTTLRNYSETLSYDTYDVINYNDGNLKMSVSQFDDGTIKTPVSLTSKNRIAFNKGYLEVRAKMSATPGQWAGIWLVSEEDPNTGHHGEIDIAETNYSGTSFKPNVHAWNGTERLDQFGEKAEKYVYEDKNFNKTEYHIYGFEWDDTALKFYVDGECYETIYLSELTSEAYDGILDQFYVIRLQNDVYTSAFSNTSDNVMPEFTVDYVRLYQKDGEQFKVYDK